MKQARMCPEGGECIAPKVCKATKPCWWMKQKSIHDAIKQVVLDKKP